MLEKSSTSDSPPFGVIVLYNFTASHLLHIQKKPIQKQTIEKQETKTQPKAKDRQLLSNLKDIKRKTPMLGHVRLLPDDSHGAVLERSLEKDGQPRKEPPGPALLDAIVQRKRKLAEPAKLKLTVFFPIIINKTYTKNIFFPNLKS